MVTSMLMIDTNCCVYIACSVVLFCGWFVWLFDAVTGLAKQAFVLHQGERRAQVRISRLTERFVKGTSWFNDVYWVVRIR